MHNICLSPVDGGIILLYLAVLVFIGFRLKRKASRNLESYLLGGKSIPWYMLGLSNASGMFDVSGTVWLVSIAVLYGLKSIYLPWLWPTFNQIFLMVYLSVWLRRSGCTTGAEWIGFRFGHDKGARMAHWIVVVFAILVGLSMLAYGFVGMGKFVEIFLPLKAVFPFFAFVPDAYVPHVWGILFTLFAAFYALMGGMMSIVWADVAQYFMMALAGVAVALIAMAHLDPEVLNAVVPAGWHSAAFGWRLDLDWTGTLAEFNTRLSSDGYQLFGIFIGMMLLKGMLASMAGPAPTYDMQKILSTRSPKEAALMSGSVSVILMPVRYLMIAGFAILGILLYPEIGGQVRNAAGEIDFELVLPAVVAHPWIPVGLTGLILAGLLAAFMSTFAGTLNAVQAYIVSDIYLKYFCKDPTPRRVNRANYWVGGLVVCVSIAFGVWAEDVNSVLQWVTGALYGSYVASNILKWHWWRFNGYGFAWGMLAGLVPALVLPMMPFFSSMLPLYYFPLILALSVLGCVGGTLLSPATEKEVLLNFYVKTRPWGWWKPVERMARQHDASFQPNKQVCRDLTNVAVGIVWQTAMVAAPMYLVWKNWGAFAGAMVLIVAATWFLKVNWYNHISD